MTLRALHAEARAMGEPGLISGALILATGFGAIFGLVTLLSVVLTACPQ